VTHTPLDAPSTPSAPTDVAHGCAESPGAAAEAERPRLRIAQVLVGFRPDGGAERLVRTFLDEMQSFPCDTVVFTLKPGANGDDAELRALGAELVKLPARRLIDPVRFARLVRALRRGHFDVVHTHLAGANILGVVAASLLRIPSVVTLHSTRSSADDHWYHGRLERFVLRRLATTLIAVGEETAIAQSDRIGRRDLVVMPNAVTPIPPLDPAVRRTVRNAIMADPDRRLVLTVGRLEPPKAHADLIDAFAAVVRRGVDAELAIVGRGSLQEETEAVVAAHGLCDRVHFLGVRDDVHEVMHAADLFALSSRWEGLPMVLLEAMESELPIVSTDVGDVGAVLDDSAARVVPPGDPGALADGLVEALADLDVGRDLTTAAVRTVRERYSSAGWACQLYDRYAEIVR